MIEERVKKFKCNPAFYPYLTKVLAGLPEDILQREILDGALLEVVSINPEASGKWIRLPFPASHIIILNEAILQQSEPEIVHVIAHEIGHKVARGGKSGLWEKDAEDPVKAWGFEEESGTRFYYPAILEIEGYEIGYQWAAIQTDLDDFKEFLHDWCQDSLTSDRHSQLIELVEVFRIVEEPFGSSPEGRLLCMVNDGQDCFKTAVAYGVMSLLEDKYTEPETDLEGKSEESSVCEIYCQCGWCGRDVKYGNASLTIERRIEQADLDSENDCVHISVIDAIPLVTLCAHCARELNHEAIPEALAACRFDDCKKTHAKPEK